MAWAISALRWPVPSKPKILIFDVERSASTTAADPLWTTLDVTPDGSLLVKCNVDGRRVLGMLDTGAAVSIIDPNLLPAQPARAQDWTHIGAEWGARTLATATPTAIRLGGESLVSARPILADLSWLTETVGQRVGVIIGQDILAQRLCILEFSARRFALVRSDPVLSNRWRRIGLIRSTEGRLCLEVRVEGGPPVLATLDLGSSNAVMMSSAFASARGLFDGRPTSTAATNTLAGAQISRTLTLGALKFAGVTIKSAPADAFDTWNDPRVPLNLGFPVFFRRFDLMIDMAAKVLWLAPNKDADISFDRDRSGLGLAFAGDRLRVVHVAKASPAAAGGWRIGEEITTIDGRAVDKGYFRAGRSKWRNGPDATRIELGGSFGVRTLVLATYY